MLIVGITGRSGSGKSTLSRYYAGKGYLVVDGDALSREVTGPGSDCLRALVEAFGEGILDEAGALKRRELANIAFKTPEGTETLTYITHPYILQAFLERAEQARARGEKLVFIDGAVILGGPFEPYCDRLIVLVSEQRLAVSRIILRDGISKTAAQLRLAAQTPEDTLRRAADYVLENNAGEDALFLQADRVLVTLLEAAENEETNARKKSPRSET